MLYILSAFFFDAVCALYFSIHPFLSTTLYKLILTDSLRQQFLQLYSYINFLIMLAFGLILSDYDHADASGF